MKFIENKLKGSYLIEIDPIFDERGYFVRTFDINIFKGYGIDFNIVQTNLSYNKKKGTIRGIHYQEKYEEAKIVQCISGSIYDVILDIRENSYTKGMWTSVILENDNMLYIPKGFAHGYQTLKDDTLILYYMDEFYHPEYSKTISYDDKRYNIKWYLI